MPVMFCVKKKQINPHVVLFSSNWKAKGALWGHNPTASLLGHGESLSFVVCFWESESALRLRNNTNANPGVPASALKVLNYPSLLRVPYCKPALRLFSVGSHFGVLRSPGAVLNVGQKFYGGSNVRTPPPANPQAGALLTPYPLLSRGRLKWRTEVSPHC